MILHIGIDDTDSPKGGCTTYIAAIVLEELFKLETSLIDYPTLLRLNPNTPWKTRGNASICIRVKIEKDSEDQIIEKVIKIVEKHSRFDCEGTNPGIVFHYNDIPTSFKLFSKNTVQSLVKLKKADDLIKKNHSLAFGYKNRRGIIGALAAIGGLLEIDHTYEILTYRKEKNRGTMRRIDDDSVIKMNNLFYKQTFNNYDLEKKTVLITPHGPDPIFYGIRGENPKVVYQAHKNIKVFEEIERWVIFLTNQGTNAHFRNPVNISEVKENHPAGIHAEVEENPLIIKGGHVIFKIKDNTGNLFCAAYEPTGNFRKIIRDLIPGDKIQVFGGIKQTKKGLTLNLEKITVLQLTEKTYFQNPKCPECEGSMESLGWNSGFRCKKCGFKGKNLKKIRKKIDRKIFPGMYMPHSGAQRHLTKPLKRYGKEKNCRRNNNITKAHETII